MPPELKATGERFMAKQSEEEQRPAIEESFSQEAYDAPLEVSAHIPEEAFEKKPEESTYKVPTPEENLSRIGIYLTDDDYHNIVFRGGFEKDIVVIPSRGKMRELRASIKTLKTKEYDAIDELLAEDVGTIKMTNEGFTSRRSLWILTFAVTKLDGKPLSKPIFTRSNSGDRDVVDLKATARDRKEKVIGELSPVIVNELIALHAALTTNMDLILNEQKGAYLKKLSPPREA